MSNEKSNSTTSIEQLYKNRKQQYKMPESLRESLEANARKNTRRQHWRYAIPFAFASVLAVVFVWPNKTELFAPQMAYYSAKQKASDSIVESEIASPSMSKALSQPDQRSMLSDEQHAETETLFAKEDSVADEEIVSEDIVASNEAGIATLSKKSIAKPAAIPVEKPAATLARKSKANTEATADMTSPMDLDMLAEDFAELAIEAAPAAAPASSFAITIQDSKEQKSEPEEQSVKSLEPSQVELDVGESRTLKVVDGDKGLFEDCAGKELELPVKTELLNWVIITLDQERNYSVEQLDEAKCDIED